MTSLERIQKALDAGDRVWYVDICDGRCVIAIVKYINHGSITFSQTEGRQYSYFFHENKPFDSVCDINNFALNDHGLISIIKRIFSKGVTDEAIKAG